MLISIARSLKNENHGNDVFGGSARKKYAIESHNHSQNGAEVMVQAAKSLDSQFIELLKAPKENWHHAIEHAVLCMNRAGITSLDWKTPCEEKFGENPVMSCLKCKFYQPARVGNNFVNFPNH